MRFNLIKNNHFHFQDITTQSKQDIVADQNGGLETDILDLDEMNSACQRPIEDILEALDQLVLSAPREVEISIDWGVLGPVNITEKTVLPSDASGDRSEISETDGLAEDRRRDIETLLKEVDECLKLHKGREQKLLHILDVLRATWVCFVYLFLKCYSLLCIT